MKLISARLLSLAISLLVLSTLVAGCATVKHTAGVVVQQGIDCAKAEIANQVPNVLAGVNTILADPSTLQPTKDAEITSLLSSKDELIACVLRQVIGDIRDAVVPGAAPDPAVRQMHDAAADLIRMHGYTYADGWEQLEQ